MVNYVYKINKEVPKVLDAIFAFVESILGGAGADPEATNIVAQVFDFVLSLFKFGA